MRSQAILVVAVLLCTCGCARMGDPLPPLLHIPQPAGSLKLRQIGSQIRLTFQLPARNTDGSPLQGLREVQVYRCIRSDSASPGAPDAGQLRQPNQLIASLGAEQLKSYRPGNPVEFVDSLDSIRDADPYRGDLFYGIDFVGVKKHSSGIAVIQKIRPMAVARPVTVRALLQPESIRLEWEAPLANTDDSTPARIAGYRVYRSLQDPPRFDQPLGSVPPENSWYEDRDFVLGRNARYAVSVVSGADQSVAESRWSEIVLVEPRDIFPPAVPLHLEAFGLAEGVSLRWDANRESDLLGYHLYRSDSEAEIGRRLTEKALDQTSYLDRSAERQKSYYYRLTAVDKAGNESRPTEPVTLIR